MSKLQSYEREAFETVERAPEAQAKGFATVRRAHESEMAEDYVELIAELIELRGEARPVEIAERLGVKSPTVTKNISRLKAAGLVRRAENWPRPVAAAIESLSRFFSAWESTKRLRNAMRRGSSITSARPRWRPSSTPSRSFRAASSAASSSLEIQQGETQEAAASAVIRWRGSICVNA